MKRIIFFLPMFFMLQWTFAQNDPITNIAIIKSLRAASNEALARHDINGMAEYWLDDLSLVRGNSSHLSGKDTIVSAWKKLFNENPIMIVWHGKREPGKPLIPIAMAATIVQCGKNQMVTGKF